MITHSISMRRKKTSNSFSGKVLSYMNKTGHFTANILNKGHSFYMYWAKCFDLLKQIANTLNYPVYE